MAPSQNQYTSTVTSQYPVYPDTLTQSNAPFQNIPYAHQLSGPAAQLPAPPAPVYAPPSQCYSTQDPQNAPVNDWLRWGQTHLTTYPQAPPQQFMSSAAGPSMAMGVGAQTQAMTGSQSGGAGPAMNDPANQWPMNVYHLGQQHNANNPG